MNNELKDRYGRETDNLRFSVTQKCNFDCIYCHNEGEGSHQGGEITKDEIIKAAEVGVKHGVKKVKLSGGEPLLRDDIYSIIQEISPMLEDLSMTSNASILAGNTEKLAESGLDRINISLDSLDTYTYNYITGGARLKDSLEGIDAAIDAGLKPVKINTVVMKNLNEGELDDFLKFAKDMDIILQLIEFHDTQTLNIGNSYDKYHTDLSEIEKEFEEIAERTATRKMHHRKKYFFGGAEVEVVKPMHNTEFCKNCTRLRVTSDGKFKPCLMRNDNHVPFGENIEEAFFEAIDRREPHFK